MAQSDEWGAPLSSRQAPIRFIKGVQEGRQCQESPAQAQLGTIHITGGKVFSVTLQED